MATEAVSRKEPHKQLSARRPVHRKIFRFSLCIGLLTAFLSVFVVLAVGYPQWRHCHDTNVQTLSEITCNASECDTSAFTTDWQIQDVDYIIDTRTRYLLNVPTSTDQDPTTFGQLAFSDPTFIARFQQPQSFTTINQETWRLYSREVTADDKTYAIMIGYAERAPWKMLDTAPSERPVLDRKLVSESEKIADAVRNTKGKRSHIGRILQRISADGYEVADATTGAVVTWGPWLPILLPQGIQLPQVGPRFYVGDQKLYVVQTDTDGRLLATSLFAVGNVWVLLLLPVGAFVVGLFITRGLSRKFLRNYFAFTDFQVLSVEEACRRGEGKNIEFKKNLSDDPDRKTSAEDELLKTIAAFANTNDGIIYIGIDDSAHIRGLGLDYNGRDRLERKIRQLVRNRINPTPPVQITFEEIRGLVIAMIAVACGNAPVYLLDGVVYVRYGSSDVQARAEDLLALVAAHAS